MERKEGESFSSDYNMETQTANLQEKSEGTSQELCHQIWEKHCFFRTVQCSQYPKMKELNTEIQKYVFIV